MHSHPTIISNPHNGDMDFKWTYSLLLCRPHGRPSTTLILSRIYTNHHISTVPKQSKGMETPTLPTHHRFIPRSLSTFPEPRPCFANQERVAENAVFRTVVLFAGAIATVKHTIHKQPRRRRKRKRGVVYQIIRFACSFGWSVAASWHLVRISVRPPWILQGENKFHGKLTCRTGRPWSNN